MDLVNIRKKAKQEKEKEGKIQETKEGVSPMPEEEVKAEPEETVTEVKTPIQEGITEPLTQSDVVVMQEKIKEEVHEVASAPYSEEDAEVEVISFQLGEETYGVEIERVKEILKPLQITPVPRTPDYLKGVTSLRGEIIPVFDLKKRLGLEGPEEGKKRRILILSVRHETMGAMIDEVKGVIKLRRGSIEPPPTIITGVEADFLEGVSRIDNQFIGLLNIEEVMKI